MRLFIPSALDANLSGMDFGLEQVQFPQIYLSCVELYQRVASVNHLSLHVDKCARLFR